MVISDGMAVILDQDDRPGGRRFLFPLNQVGDKDVVVVVVLLLLVEASSLTRLH